MPETLEDVLPPAPHKVLKEGIDGAKGALDGLKGDVKGVVDDIRDTAMEMAPHNLIKGMDPKELLPPAPPKPPRPGQ